MANFPDQLDVFLQATDIANPQDVAFLKQYQSLIYDNKFADAAIILATWQGGMSKQYNASRFNQVLDAVQKIEEFYLGNAGVKAYIDHNVNSFTYINTWINTTTYLVGQITIHNDEFGNPTWFKALQSNTNIEPLVLNNWQEYWQVYLMPNRAKQYPLQSTQPIGQEVGELWWQIVTP